LKPKFAVLVAVALSGAELSAQCLEWSPKFHAGGVDGRVIALAEHDFGQGPRLVLGGEFEFAAGKLCANVAVWDGERLAQLGDGLSREVEDLQVFQGELYAAGWFDFGPLTGGRVARFDGAQWQPVGAGFNDIVRSLAVHQGSLYAAGRFTSDSNGNASVSRVARFDGVNWVQVGAGVSGGGWVNEIESFDLGSGAQLWALGSPAFGTQRFDGASWTDLTPGLSIEGWTMALFDAGAGNTLFAGFNDGALSSWNGAAWQPVAGSPTGARLRRLLVHDDGSGSALYATGEFSFGALAGARNLARWNGAGWSAVGSGLGASGPCHALASFDDGSGNGTELWVGGAFAAMHEIGADGIAAWNGSQWRSTAGDALLRNALAPASGFTVEALEHWTPPGAARPWVFAAGDFQSAGGAPIESIAAYDGASWSPLGAGVDGGVSVMLGAADLVSATSSLYVGGDLLSAGGGAVSRLARWDGANWHDVGGGTSGTVLALHRTNAPEFGGPSLFVGGRFFTAGGLTVNSLGRFDGSQWHALGSGADLSGSSLPASVLALAEYDDPSTPEGMELFAAGAFDSVGGVATLYCARWDGATWREAGAGLVGVGNLRDLELFDDGSGTKLFALSASGALFVRSPGVWSQVAAPVGSGEAGLVVHNDGAGARLYSGRNVWNGLSWTTFATLTPGAGVVTSGMSVVDPFHGRAALWLGGQFDGFDGVPSRNIARWSDPCAALATYCTAKINSLGCAPSIGWSGEPALSQLATTPFEIAATNVVNQKNGVLFYSTSGRRATPFQGGVLCVAAPLRRTPFRSSAGSPSGADCTGVLSLDFSPWLTGVNDPTLEIGLIVDAQWWYRDPASPSTTGLSNALELEIRP
jgi:hypothetical protein